MGVTEVLQMLALATVVCSLIGGCLPGARPPPAPLPVQVVRVVHRPVWTAPAQPVAPVKSLVPEETVRLDVLMRRARERDPFRQGMARYETRICEEKGWPDWCDPSLREGGS